MLFVAKYVSCQNYFHILNRIKLKTTRNFHFSQIALLRKIGSNRTKALTSEEKCDTEAYSSSEIEHPNSKINENFYGIESDVGVIITGQRSMSNMCSFGSHGTKTNSRVPEEKLCKASFGIIRRDFDNILKYHGQFERNAYGEDIERQQIYTHVANTYSYIYDNKIDLSNSSITSKSKMMSSTVKDRKHIEFNTYSNNNKLPTHSDAFSEIKSKVNYKEQETNNFENDCFEKGSDKSNVHNLVKHTDEWKLPTEKSENNFSYINEQNFQKHLKSDPTHINEEFVKQDITKSFESETNFHSKVNGINQCDYQNTLGNDLELNDTEHGNGTLRKTYTTKSDNINSSFESGSTSTNFIDEQYFQNNLESNTKRKEFTEHDFGNMSESKTNDKANFSSVSNFHFIDQQYFQNNQEIETCESTDQIFKKLQKTELENVSLSLKPRSTNFVDHQDFQGNLKDKLNIKNTESADQIFYCNTNLNSSIDSTSTNFVDEQYFQEYAEENQSNILSESVKSNLGGFKMKNDYKSSIDKKYEANTINYSNNLVVPKNMKTIDPKNINPSTGKKSLLDDKPVTAHDLVSNIRQDRKASHQKIVEGVIVLPEEGVDSKGFKIYKNQVPNLSYFTRDEILEMLSKRVLYADDDIVVLDKPYNLVIHESQTVKEPCLSTFLKDLAQELDKKSSDPQLYTVHRLDKETTGCLLLARNEIMAEKLKSFFSRRMIQKTYWIVSSGVPDPLEGIIDIPISEGTINKKSRMVLHPDLPKDIKYRNHSKQGKRAVTHYTVIATQGNAALVEVKPATGLKHQIRVHFGFGLSCPILGDHKYSHLDKLAPQKLTSDVLQRLGVRQSKVRHIPMHIHARSVVIPEHLDGKNLFVYAPLPPHMRKNMKSEWHTEKKRLVRDRYMHTSDWERECVNSRVFLQCFHLLASHMIFNTLVLGRKSCQHWL